MLAHGVAAANPHLAKARAHVDALALDLAQGALDLAVRAGDNDRAAMAEIYRLLGVVAAGLDQPAAAQEHFRHLLALDPAAAPPDAYGPKISQPFADARASMAGRAPFGVVVEPAAVDATSVVVVVTDPGGLVAGVRARFGGPPEREGAGTRVTLPAPPHAARVTVALVDAFGNRLLERTIPITRAAPAPLPTPPPAPTSVFARWPLWAITSGAFVATGVGLALAARSTQADLDALKDDSPPPSFSEVDALDTRGRRLTLGANVAFALGAATGVVAAVLLFRGEPSSAPAVAVTPAEGGGGAVFGLGGRF